MSTESYTHGALALMDKHAASLRPAYALTPDEQTLMLARGDFKFPDPVPYVPPRKRSYGKPEAEAAFKEWLDTPEIERYRGLASGLARKHGAVIMHVQNKITKWKCKKENQT